MREDILQWIQQLPPPLAIFLVAMLPIFELRGAIPWGLARDNGELSWWLIYLLAVAGNMVPIFFIPPVLRLLERLFSRIGFMRRFLDWLYARTRKRSGGIEKYEELGLILFVAIPLPVTGAWTGAMAAYIFGLSYWKSLACILAGVCIAGLVVTFLSSMLIELGLVGLGVLVAAALAWYIVHKARSKRHGSVRQKG